MPILKNAARRVVSLVKRKPKTPEDIIAASDYFDAKWYLEKYPDVASHPLWIKRPAGHYVRHGALEGRNPSTLFNSSWYLKEYEDVAQSGLNPLLHFILHGEEEGRYPKRNARRKVNKVDLNRVETLRAKMWGGYANACIPRLAQKALKESNAAWHLAAWFYAHGDVAKAVQYIEQAITQSANGASRRKLVALAKCFSMLKDAKALAALLHHSDARANMAHLLPYAEANLAAMHNDQNGQLSAVNALLSQFELSAIAVKPAADMLSLGTITSDCEPYGDTAQPLVSIIVPAFNAASTLSIAIDSLLKQTWRNLEILVVDDASTDNTAAVVKAYAQQDKRVRYLANAQNSGAYPSRNNGMRHAQGEFVTVHDSDDWSHPEKIARQVRPLIDNPRLKATYSSWVRVLPDLTFVGSWYLNDVFVEKNHSSLLLRRETLKDTGLWDAVNVAADTEFMWRLELHFGQKAIAHILPEAPLSFALSDDSSLTRTKASHVKTIHYGLRRLYREAARWWHRKFEHGGVMPENGRPFPLPLGISRQSPRKFDYMLVADFASAGEAKLTQVLAKADTLLAKGYTLTLFHWPKFMSFHGAEITEAVFDFCHKHQLQFAHAGIEIHCPNVIVSNANVLDVAPDQVVQVSGVKRVEDLDGNLLEQQAAWSDFWLTGADALLPVSDQQQSAPDAITLKPAPAVKQLFARHSAHGPCKAPEWQIEHNDFVKQKLYKNGFLAAINGAQTALHANSDIAHWHQVVWADWQLWLQNSSEWHVYQQRLALIGTAFDAYNKVLTPDAVLLKLAAELAKGDTAFLNALDNLSGKFVLLVRHDDGWKVYNDAFSARSIFYHDEVGGVLASHAALLADAVKAAVETEALTFVQHADFKARDVKYLPGRRTLYRNLYYCPANHCLVMAAHKTERYWPRAGTHIDSDAGKSLIRYLDGYGDFIKANYDQEFFGLTAGMDSRVLFSLMLAKQIPMQVFTMLRGDPSGGSKADMQMATDMCKHFNVPHRQVTVDFKRLTNQSFTASMQVLRANTGHMRGNAMVANAQFSDEVGEELSQKRTSYSRGFGGEIMRGFYHRQGGASAKHFAGLYGLMPGSSYVRDSFEHFVACTDFSNTHGISVNDLYYWEHRMSGWAALGIAETDIFANTFAGYNSRRLYEAFMRETAERREARQGFRDAIAHFCPKLLDWEFA